nr:DNA polymerase III subunit delta [Levilactobacillus bambusae]
MKIFDLIQQLKQPNLESLASIYVILGQQDYLQRQIREGFIHLIPADEKTMNYASYDMDTTPLAVALDDAMSAPFFGEHRIVIIENPLFLSGETKKQKPDHDIEGLIHYLEHPEPTTTLIFFAPYAKLDARKKVTKRLKKAAEFVEINQLDERQIKAYVQNDIKRTGYSIEPNALAELLQRTDADLTLMMAELPKLELYCLGTKQIDLSAVDDLVTKTLTQNVFDLVNDVLSHNTKASVTLYRQLLEAKEEPLKINAILIGQFRLLIQVKVLSQEGYSQGSLASALKVHPYRIKLALQMQKKFNLTDLNQAYLGLVDVETKMKSSQTDPELLFELFMTRFVDNRVVNH